MLTMLGGRDTQTLLDGKKNFELYAHTSGGEAKTFWFSLPLSASAGTISGTGSAGASAPFEPPGETFTT